MCGEKAIKDVDPKVAKELFDWGYRAASEKVECFQSNQCYKAQMDYLYALSGTADDTVEGKGFD